MTSNHYFINCTRNIGEQTLSNIKLSLCYKLLYQTFSFAHQFIPIHNSLFFTYNTLDSFKWLQIILSIILEILMSKPCQTLNFLYVTNFLPNILFCQFNPTRNFFLHTISTLDKFNLWFQTTRLDLNDTREISTCSARKRKSTVNAFWTRAFNSKNSVAGVTW